jgi:hypothetical protein
VNTVPKADLTSAFPSTARTRWPALVAVDWRVVLAFSLPFILYVLTLAPTIYNLDSAELTTAAVTGGFVRATGYPLYLLLGRVWSALPIGDAGYRMNLLSAFAGALTVALIERILRRVSVGPWAALGALGLLASAPYFWAMSLVAEVYTLHTALMAIIILLLLRWGENPTLGRLALVGVAFGLSLGHHAATVLLIPGCVWYVLTLAPRRALAPRSLLVFTVTLLAGASVYLYLPWRYGSMPSFNYVGYYNAVGNFVPTNLRTPQGMWWLISGRVFADEMMGYQSAELWHETSQFGVQLWQAFLGLGLGPGLLGIFVLLRRDWRLGGMFLWMFVANAGFYVSYKVIDKNTMFLPAYLLWAVWLGIGYQCLLAWIGTEVSTPLRHWGAVLARIVMTGAVLFATAWNWRFVDLSNDWSARARGEQILSSVESNALILGWWDTVPLIEYLQLVEGQRPDVQAINRFLIRHDDLVRLIRQEVTRRPVYIDSLPDDLPLYSLGTKAGPLYRLRLSHPQIDMD